MSFNLDDIAETEDRGFKLLPKGGYRVLVSEASFKHKTGDVNTNWISVRFDVLPYDGTGDYELMGRRIYNNYTWENRNAQAVEIGRQQLADLIYAANPELKTLNHPQDAINGILDREIYVEVYHSKRKDTGEMETRIGGYWSVSGRQRRKNPKPIPPPPSAADVASAPAQAPRGQASGYGTLPGTDIEDVPF